MTAQSRVLGGLMMLLVLGVPQSGRGAVAIDQVTDINNAGGVMFGGPTNVFTFGPVFGFDDTAVFMGNDLVVFSMDGVGASNDGAGLSISISNGENGIDSSNGGLNVDMPNDEPPHPVFETIGNPSGKLENGNAVRFSMWMRQDPNSPVTAVPSIEPVVKIELWKEALSGFADFNPGPFPGEGDRIWDTDQNASNTLHQNAGQSQASWVDMNNSGTTSFGNPVAQSLVTDEWRLVEAYLVVDDDPLDDGLGWSIGVDFFDVSHVEEIRAVVFMGDFASPAPDLTGAGAIWIDNLMLEVFRTEADMLATPNPNTAPIEGVGPLGDHNGDGVVDAADYTAWRDAGGSIVGFEEWKENFGAGIGGGVSLPASATAVPEPAGWLLVLMGLGAAGAMRRRH